MGCAADVAAAPGNATCTIVVFSDGFPTTDTHPAEAAAVTRDLGIPIYPIVLGDQKLVDQARQAQESGTSPSSITLPPVSNSRIISTGLLRSR